MSTFVKTNSFIWVTTKYKLRNNNIESMQTDSSMTIGCDQYMINIMKWWRARPVRMGHLDRGLRILLHIIFEKLI